MSGGAKALKKAAVQMAAATGDKASFYLQLPVREFVELNQEMATALKKK